MTSASSTRPANLPDISAPKGYDQVVAYLGDQMEQGVLKPGDRLMPERDLALRLGLSRPIVREALRALAMIGVLEIQQGRGTFVRRPDISSLGHFFSFLFAHGAGEFDDIMDVRQGLERQAVRLACLRARDSDFALIAEALETIRATIEDPDAGGKADFLFHTRLIDASHSPALIQIYAIVSRMLERNHVRRRRRIAAAPRFQEYLIDHHALLFDAVRRRDVEDSERLLIAHFEIGAKLNSEGLVAVER